jgi:methylmalonyl-CoA/ethylmalonyl-CoA epimerase
MNRAKLHHLAVVVADIDHSTKAYCGLFGVHPTTDIIHDPKQKVYVQFLSGPALGDIQLELLAPDGEDSPVASALKKGGGPNHLCFEVRDINESLQAARQQGCRVICEPIEAAAMDKRQIAFVFTPDQQIVEFVAAPTDGNE